MFFDPPLVSGRLIRRYKRFLADVVLDTGDTVTVHCPNSGSMTTCLGDSWPVLLSPVPATETGRRTRYTWELVHNGSCWIGINTQRANRIAEEAVRSGQIPELAGYDEVLTEKRYGRNSRIDLLLQSCSRPLCYVEVKNVTLLANDGCCAFPDAVTERGRKHLSELSRMVREGHRAVTLFLVQRGDASPFRPADEIDSAYGRALRRAAKTGVELLAYRTESGPETVRVTDAVPVFF